MAEKKIVSAVASMSASRDRILAAQIEHAMNRAVGEALAAGVDINNSKEILKWKLAAREAVVKG